MTEVFLAGEFGVMRAGEGVVTTGRSTGAMMRGGLLTANSVLVGLFSTGF